MLVAALAQLRHGGRDVGRARPRPRRPRRADARRPAGPAGADPRDARAARATGADVVYARRIGRDESWLKRALATAFYELMERLARTPYQGQAGDFRLMSRRVVDDAARGCPSGAASCAGWSPGWASSRCRSSTAAPAASRRAALLPRSSSGSRSRRSRRSPTCRWRSRPTSGSARPPLSALGAVVILVLSIARVVSGEPRVWILVAVLFLGGVQLISVGILGPLPGAGARADAARGRSTWSTGSSVAERPPPIPIPIHSRALSRRVAPTQAVFV